MKTSKHRKLGFETLEQRQLLTLISNGGISGNLVWNTGEFSGVINCEQSVKLSIVANINDTYSATATWTDGLGNTLSTQNNLTMHWDSITVPDPEYPSSPVSPRSIPYFTSSYTPTSAGKLYVTIAVTDSTQTLNGTFPTNETIYASNTYDSSMTYGSDNFNNALNQIYQQSSSSNVTIKNPGMDLDNTGQLILSGGVGNNTYGSSDSGDTIIVPPFEYGGVVLPQDRPGAEITPSMPPPQGANASPHRVGDDNNWDITESISGTGSMLIDEDGVTVTLCGDNSYSGFALEDGSVIVGSATALGSSSDILQIDGGALDLGGYSPTMGCLYGSGGQITNSGSTPSTLTVNQACTSGCDANIVDGSATVGLVLNATDEGETLLLDPAAQNQYSGGTTVENGTLLAASNYAIPVNEPLVIGAGGTLIYDPTYSVNNPSGGDDDMAQQRSPAQLQPVAQTTQATTVQSIATVGQQATSATSVQFSVTLSQATGNLTTANFAVSAAANGPTGTVTAAASPDGGTTWNVTVGNVYGAGSLGLAVTANNDLAYGLASDLTPSGADAAVHHPAGDDGPGGGRRPGGGQSGPLRRRAGRLWPRRWHHAGGHDLALGWGIQQPGLRGLDRRRLGQPAQRTRFSGRAGRRRRA